MSMAGKRYYGIDVPRSTGPHPDPLSETAPVSIDLLQRIWANLFYNEEEAGNTFQQTLNEVVDLLAAHNALPAVELKATKGGQ